MPSQVNAEVTCRRPESGIAERRAEREFVWVSIFVSPLVVGIHRGCLRENLRIAFSFVFIFFSPWLASLEDLYNGKY
jgi:hypothetical protein